LGPEADHLPPSSAEVTMTVAVPSLLPRTQLMNLFEGIAQFVYKFLKILSHARINFEEQIKNLGASIIIVNS